MTLQDTMAIGDQPQASRICGSLAALPLRA